MLEVWTKDLKRLQLDEAGAARFRIADPHLFVWAVGSVEHARVRLAPIFDMYILRIVSNRTAAELLDQADAIEREIARLTDEHAREFGVAVVEVKLKWRGVDPKEPFRR